MTRADFEKRAIRDAERVLKVPEGWWGTYFDIHSPLGVRVRHGQSWIVRHGGVIVARRESRGAAIRAAVQYEFALAAGTPASVVETEREVGQ